MMTTTTSTSRSVKPRTASLQTDNNMRLIADFYPDDVGAVFDCLNPTTLSVISHVMIGSKARSTRPWSMLSVAVPAKRVAVVAPCDDTLVILVLRFPFAEAVTIVVEGGFVLGLVTVKSKVALRTPVSLA